jgi:hypothetical protein
MQGTLPLSSTQLSLTTQTVREQGLGQSKDRLGEEAGFLSPTQSRHPVWSV